MGMAWKNIKSRKYSSFKVIISMIVMIIILCIFTAYTIALADESNRVVYSYRAGHYYQVDNDELMSGVSYENLKEIDNINHIDNCAVLNTKLRLTQYKFIIDGKELVCNHSTTGDNWYGNLYSGLLHTNGIGFYENDDFISTNQLQEYRYRWGEFSSPIVSGVSKVTGNSIVVSQAFLDEYGLDNITKKQIGIKIDDSDKVFTVDIVGIIDNNFFDLTSHSNAPHIIMSTQNEIFNVAKESFNKHFSYNTKIFIKDYMSTKQVATDIVKVAGIGSFVVGSEYGLSMASTVTIVGNILTGVMSTIGLAIIIALVLNIIVSMRYMIVKKINYYGIISAYGVKRRGIFNILFSEMSIISVFSIIIAYLVSYSLVYLLDFILSQLINIGVIFSWYNFLITLGVAVLFTLIVLIIITSVSYSILAKKTTIKLLKHGMDN